MTRNSDPPSPTRRSVFKTSLAAAAGSLISFPAIAQTRRPRLAEDDPANLKIAIKVMVATLRDEELLFLKQIGLRWVHADFAGEADLALMKAAQERFAAFGMKIDCGIMRAYRAERLQLGKPGRDEDIAAFNRFIEDCGRLGIRTVHIDFHPANTYETASIDAPRGYKSREFSTDDFRKKVEKQKFDRTYSAEEIWANFTYFIDAILPVAEKANVKLALHPDDPPISPMNGVSKIFIDYAGYKRAEEVVAKKSGHFGLNLCLGTWLEGGPAMGKSAIEMIRDFGGRGKLFTVHFRNVSGTLPVFHETFQDDGYQDMYELMKALREVRCDASIIPDHYPGIVGDANERIAITYTVTLMRMLLRRANEEIG